VVYTVDVYVIKEDLTKAAGKRQGERGSSIWHVVVLGL
jgi:hypothetical protein